MYSIWQGWIELCMVNLVPQFDPKLTYAPNSRISGSSSPVLSGLYAMILDHAFWFWVHLIDTNSCKCSVKFCECQECSTSFLTNFSTVYLYSKIKCRWSNESIWVKVVIYSITSLFAAWKFTVNYISFFLSFFHGLYSKNSHLYLLVKFPTAPMNAVLLALKSCVQRSTHEKCVPISSPYA